MPYWGLPYFVTQKADYDSRVDLYAREHRRLPSRTHGIRFASAPRRREGVTTYARSDAVRPAGRMEGARAPVSLSDVDPKRALAALAVIVAIAVVCAFAGIAAVRALTGLVGADTLANPYGNDNATRAASLSEPQKSWQKGVVPTLYQDDPQWADRPYGPGTIGSAGAAPLCLSMVCIEAFGDAGADPVEAASFSQRSGYAESTDASELLTAGAAELGLEAEPVSADELAIRGALVGGRPVVAQVRAGAFGTDGTYIVLSDIDERGMLIVKDPLSRERSSRHWSFDEICSEAESMWCYSPA